MDISSTFLNTDLMAWFHPQEEMHTKYIIVWNMARAIFTIIPHAVRAVACFSVGRNMMRWRQSTTTGETLREKVVVRQFALTNNSLLTGDNLPVDTMNTDNGLETKREVEQNKLHRMPRVHDML